MYTVRVDESPSVPNIITEKEKCSKIGKKETLKRLNPSQLVCSSPPSIHIRRYSFTSNRLCLHVSRRSMLAQAQSTSVGPNSLPRRSGGRSTALGSVYPSYTAEGVRQPSPQTELEQKPGCVFFLCPATIPQTKQKKQVMPSVSSTSCPKRVKHQFD